MAAGLIGCLAYWKRQSLMSDAISHAALPGVVLSFMIFQEKNLLLLIIGAGISGLVGALLIQMIKSMTRISEDTAMGLILAVFFGGGIMLLTMVNRSGSGNQAGLDQFIFGQAASMVRQDVLVMSTLAIFVILVIFIGFKEWKLYLFDPSFAKGIGLSLKSMNILYLILLVLTIVIGIQAVGVILMSALLIIPPVSARYWTHSFKVMMWLSALFGASAGAIGTLISAFGSGWPTGPFIVVASSVLFLVSLLFGVKKGIVIEYIMLRKQKKKVDQDWNPPFPVKEMDR
nr:iron chelate uptake ABC transporter family permease subunit [Bacillus sp. B15-48]